MWSSVKLDVGTSVDVTHVLCTRHCRSTTEHSIGRARLRLFHSKLYNEWIDVFNGGLYIGNAWCCKHKQTITACTHAVFVYLTFISIVTCGWLRSSRKNLRDNLERVIYRLNVLVSQPTVSKHQQKSVQITGANDITQRYPLHLILSLSPPHQLTYNWLTELRFYVPPNTK